MRPPGLALAATLTLESATVGTTGQDGLPPLHVPLRFFLTAPLFGVLAGLLWLYDGDAAFATRWAPGMVAAVHLLTLGFFTMVMFGALFQVVPVLGGRPIPHATLVATVAHVGLTGGTLALAAGLWMGARGWLVLALVLLGLAFAVFVPAVAWGGLRRRAAGLRPVRLALLAFGAAALLGATMAAAISWPKLGIAFRDWTNVHAAWGGLGWGLLLVIGVGHQVVPMFHVTPPFGRFAVRGTAPVVAIGLVLLAVPAPFASGAGTLLIAAAGLFHVGSTLRLLRLRRRRRRDATVFAWQCGLSCIGVALLLALAELLVPAAWRPLAMLREPELLLAVVFGLLGLGTIVLGMLMKIVPFLVFLHLQRRCLPAIGAAKHLPSMDEIVSGRAAFTLLGVHLAAAAAVVAAVLAPTLARFAGALLVADFLLCFAIVVTATRRYRRAGAAIDAAVAAAPGVG